MRYNIYWLGVEKKRRISNKKIWLYTRWQLKKQPSINSDDDKAADQFSNKYEDLYACTESEYTYYK